MIEDTDKFVDDLREEIASRLADQLDQRPLYTPDSLADRLAVSRRVVYDLLAGPDPQIPSFLIGTKQRRIRAADVDAYLARLQASEEGSDAA